MRLVEAFVNRGSTVLEIVLMLSIEYYSQVLSTIILFFQPLKCRVSPTAKVKTCSEYWIPHCVLKQSSCFHTFLYGGIWIDWGNNTRKLFPTHVYTSVFALFQFIYYIFFFIFWYLIANLFLLFIFHFVYYAFHVLIFCLYPLFCYSYIECLTVLWPWRSVLCGREMHRLASPMYCYCGGLFWSFM